MVKFETGIPEICFPKILRTFCEYEVDLKMKFLRIIIETKLNYHACCFNVIFFEIHVKNLRKEHTKATHINLLNKKARACVHKGCLIDYNNIKSWNIK